MQTYEPMCGDTINNTAQVLVNMANKAKEPAKASFNDIEITANPGDNPESIVQFYHAESNRRREAYVNSPEYKTRQREAEENRQKKERELESALKSAPAKMMFRDEEGWKKSVAANTDVYGAGVIRYAERWARLMEGRIANGDTVEACAKETSHLADNEGITGFMYGAAVSILSQVWVHGEQLRRWSDKDAKAWNAGDEAEKQGEVEVEAMKDRRLLAAYLNITSPGFRDKHKGHEEIMLRNGRWGTCSGCPRRGNRVAPESCAYTRRYDHNIHMTRDGKFYQYGEEIERSMLVEALIAQHLRTA